MWQVPDAAEQHRFLAGEDNPQPRARPTELRHPFAERLAGDCDMGVPIEQRKVGNNYAASGCGFE